VILILQVYSLGDGRGDVVEELGNGADVLSTIPSSAQDERYISPYKPKHQPGTFLRVEQTDAVGEFIEWLSISAANSTL
jgi:hypothetical protein